MLRIWKIASSGRCIVLFAVVVVAGFLDSHLYGDVYPFAVVFKGAYELSGLPIECFSAYALKQGHWNRVALQVDEKNSQGDYVLADGLPFTKDTDDRNFDANDELVLEGKQFGEPFEQKDVPKDFLNSQKKSWRIDIKGGSGTPYGSVLLVANTTRPPALDAPPLVSFDRDREVIKTSQYQYKFHPQRAALLGDVRIERKGREIQVFKDSTFLMVLKLPWYLPNFVLDEKNFSSTIESWQVGPVRSIVAVGVKLKNFLSIFNFHMFSELVFYENAMQIPTLVEFTFDPTRYFKPGTGLAYSIKFADNLSWQLDTNLVKLPNQEPEKYLLEGKKASDFPFFYAAGEFPDVKAYVKVRVDPRSLEHLPPPFVIRKDSFADKQLQTHWPWLSRLDGDLGVFIDISGVRKGIYEFGLDLILASKAEENILTDYQSVKAVWTQLH